MAGRDLSPRGGRHVCERMVPDGGMVLPKAFEHSLDLPMTNEFDLMGLYCEAAILGQGRQDAIDVLVIDASEIFLHESDHVFIGHGTGLNR